jgi:hypothetical protein
MLIREPQQYESGKGNEKITREDQSDVSRRKIVGNDHLVNVTSGCSQRERRWRNERRESKRQARSERNDSCNPDAKACKSHLCLKRAVFPPDELCRDVAKEDMEHEINEIVYADREQQVIREGCFGDRIDSKRLGFIHQRYSCGEKAYDEKREEVIAY